MAFPNTRHTLIERLAAGGDENDWKAFLADYWGPLCRFALRRSNGTLSEAEDVASSAFEVILRNRLLQKWVTSQRSKLRTLLCSVVCRLQANQFRAQNRKKLFEKEFADRLIRDALTQQPSDQEKGFHEAWAEDLLLETMQMVAQDYHSKGKGDYFRVLYGRLCEQMTIADTAESLQISKANVDNYFRHVRNSLEIALKVQLRAQVFRYSDADEEEFELEWKRLGEFLAENGGLEKAISQAHQWIDGQQIQANKPERLQETITQIFRNES